MWVWGLARGRGRGRRTGAGLGVGFGAGIVGVGGGTYEIPGARKEYDWQGPSRAQDDTLSLVETLDCIPTPRRQTRWSNWRSGCYDSAVTTYTYLWVRPMAYSALPPMFPLVPPCLTGRFKRMLILSTCRKRSHTHEKIQLPSSVLSLLQLRHFHQHSKRKVCAPSTK